MPSAHIKESKLDNGNIGLEITYGGHEAPFGGVDVSAPPMYIDRNCFSDSNGFLVLDEKLVACGWLNSGISLNGWLGKNYLGSGTWYTEGQYKNFVLAGTDLAQIGQKNAGVALTIWVWPAGTSGSIAQTASMGVFQGSDSNSPTPATAQLSVSNAYTVAAITTVTITIAGTPVNVTYNPPAGAAPNTPQLLAAAIVSAINAALVGVTAVLNSDGLTITLTTSATGSATNSTTLNVTFSPYVSSSGVTTVAGFAGGSDSQLNFAHSLFENPLSWTVVGETLYFSCPGATFMAYYQEVNGTPTFQILTQYLAANSLGKFNGQLIAAGISPGPGLRLSAPEMIIAWSAPNALGIWNPQNADGTVTGAGFNQETDIADYLTGILISNGTAVILRTQGIDYITPLSGGVVPFDFVHISNALNGEGCQDYRLVTQYDQVGVFVGNTDVYQFAGGLGAIGSKIRNMFLKNVTSGPMNRSSASGPYGNTTGNVNVLYLFLVDDRLFIYCPTSKSWMMNYLQPVGLDIHALAYWSALSAVSGQPQFNTYRYPVLATYTSGSGPVFWTLNQSIQNSDFPQANASYVIFPQEEIAVGRDITLESLLITAAGLPGEVITWTVNGQVSYRDGGGPATPLTGTLTLPGSAVSNVFANYQVFFSSAASCTVQNPQLRLDMAIDASGATNALSIAKITLFGSFDPNQRPT